MAENVDILFLMLGFPKDLEDTCLGEHGIIKHMKKNSILVDHTTSKPQLAERLYE
jgi:3-hydroxyisobutyrate dehydrogenase